MTRPVGPTVVAATLVAVLAGSVGARAAPLSEDAIRKLIAQRVDALAGPEGGIGIVVGVIGPQGRTVVGYGHRDRGDPRPLDGDTAFEIGSTGKVLTALVLAEMVVKREVSLEDPVAKYLPGMRVPERNGRSITLLDLATHTSGLPFMPDNLPLLGDPTAIFGPRQLRQFLARHELSRDIGAQWVYSDLGYWLLGQALAARAAVGYETLLRDRVAGPLGLHATAITLSPVLLARLAVGHDAVLRPSRPAASVPMLASMPAAGGGIVSTARDLLTLLSMAMGYENSPLADASALMLRTRRPMQPGSEQALGWAVTGGNADQLVVLDGATLGYASSVVWDPRSWTGVVVLSNQVTGVGDIARHLLRPSLPLEKPAAKRRTHRGATGR